MKLFIKKPHIVFMVLIAALIAVGLSHGNEIIDISIHDTMYVIHLYFLSVIIAGLFAIVALLYWLADLSGLNLSYWLNSIHVLLTIGFLIGLIYGLSFSNTEFPDFFQRSRIILFSGFAIIIGVLIFLVNIFFGMWKRFVDTSG